ncbi:acyl-CoA thioesterase [bacterium]|nr:acyl-CoA thioesterase [bacterium]
MLTLARLVESADIDRLGHVNNLVYLRWALDAAVAHSDANGWDFEQYRAIGAGWVVRAHQITYLRPALLGDGVEIRTGISDLGRVTCTRHYAIERIDPAGRSRLAEGTTHWVFIDFAKGTPKRIPPEVVQAFPRIDPIQLGFESKS